VFDDFSLYLGLTDTVSSLPLGSEYSEVENHVNADPFSYLDCAYLNHKRSTWAADWVPLPMHHSMYVLIPWISLYYTHGRSIVPAVVRAYCDLKLSARSALTSLPASP